MAAGYISLQSSYMFCEAHQCDDDQDRQTHRRQRQDLPAIPARMETCTTQNDFILISRFFLMSHRMKRSCFMLFSFLLAPQPQSDLYGLIQVMIVVFGEEPPVFSRPTTQPPYQAFQAAGPPNRKQLFHNTTDKDFP